MHLDITPSQQAMFWQLAVKITQGGKEMAIVTALWFSLALGMFGSHRNGMVRASGGDSALTCQSGTRDRGGLLRHRMDSSFRVVQLLFGPNPWYLCLGWEWESLFHIFF